MRGDPFVFRIQENGDVAVRTSGIAGTVSLGGFALDIAPKFALRPDGVLQWNVSMLLLMQYARKTDLSLVRSEHLAAGRHSFLDLLGMAFADAAEAGLADQLIQTYKISAESLPVLRGRLALSRQMRRAFTSPQLIECDVDQLDVNNAFNALLKWAAEALVRSVRSSTLKRRLHAIAHKLPGRPDRGAPNRGREFAPPPQFRVWNEALQIASLLASGLAHTTGRGIQHGYSFVFNMERLFEHFVEISLVRALSTLGDSEVTSCRQASTQYATPHWQTKVPFFSRPDNLVVRNGKPLIVVDAKYKRLSDSEGIRNRKPINADVYELVAAMTAHRCPLGLLVYPRVAGDAVLTDSELRMWTVQAFGKCLFVGALALDLTGLRTHADLHAVDQKLGAALSSLITEWTNSNDWL
nr:hypothetical protein [Caballeronia sp. ATUFL_M2_KS44]